MSGRFDPTAPIVLGETKEGEIIWTDPTELILTGDEEQELQHNKKRDAVVGVAKQMAQAVLENGFNFFRQTVVNTFGFPPGNETAAILWMNERGIECIQDGLTTVVKVRGSVIRQMTARVDARFAEETEKIVRREVGK